MLFDFGSKLFVCTIEIFICLEDVRVGLFDLLALKADEKLDLLHEFGAFPDGFSQMHKSFDFGLQV